MRKTDFVSGKISGCVHHGRDRDDRRSLAAENPIAHGAEMHPGKPGEIRFKGLKTALRTGQDRDAGRSLVRFQHGIQRFPLPGLIHEQGQIVMNRGIQHFTVIRCPGDLGDDAAPGLLGGFLADAVPALQLFVRIVRLRDTARGTEENDPVSAGFHGFLDDIIHPIALRQTAQNSDLHGRLALAGNHLDDFKFGFFLIGTDEASLIV